MKTGLGSIFAGLMSIPAAGTAWGLMWVTDRLYDWGFGLLAIPIRIAIFFAQIGVLLFCVMMIIFIALTTFGIFKGALHGENVDNESQLSVKGYMMLLLLPIAMNVASVIFGVFHNWLAFGERGLGAITIGYVALIWVLQIGSVLIIGIWLVVLPFFLRNRHAYTGPDNIL